MRPSFLTYFGRRQKPQLRERIANLAVGAVIVAVVLAALALECDIYKAAGGNGLQIDGSALRQLLQSIGRKNRGRGGRSAR